MQKSGLDSPIFGSDIARKNDTSILVGMSNSEVVFFRQFARQKKLSREQIRSMLREFNIQKIIR